MDNIKLFQAYLAVIFNDLYQRFPMTIDYDDETIKQRIKKVDEKEPISDLDIEIKKHYFYRTLIWLHNNDFIRGDLDGNNFLSVTLTPKGLAFLNSPTLDNDENIGEVISEKNYLDNYQKSGKILTDGMLEFANERILKWKKI